MTSRPPTSRLSRFQLASDGHPGSPGRTREWDPTAPQPRVGPSSHDHMPDRNGIVTAALCNRPLLFIWLPSPGGRMRMIRTVPGPTRPAMIGCRCSFRSNVPGSNSTVFAGMLVGDRGVRLIALAQARFLAADATRQPDRRGGRCRQVARSVPEPDPSWAVCIRARL